MFNARLCMYELGMVQRLAGKASCVACAPGKFSLFPGMPVFCYTCPPGKFSPASAALSCSRCAAGQIQPKNGQRSCCCTSPPTRSPTTAATTVITPAPTSKVEAGSSRSALLSMMKQLEVQVQKMRGELAETTRKEECPAGKHMTNFNGK